MSLRCTEFLRLVHKMYHESFDQQNVCITSGLVHLDTEPEITIIVIMAAVEKKDSEKFRTIGHHAIADIMTEAYGEQIKQ